MIHLTSTIFNPGHEMPCPVEQLAMTTELLAQLAPTGVLRVGLNMSNFLLVNSSNAQGEPDGVSPAMGRALASELGVECVMVPYKGPGEVADAVAHDEWDIGNIAAEPERARTINFSPAYCEIQASYLVPAGSDIKAISDVDSTGIRIAVKHRSAYDLWLSDNLQFASLVKAASIDESFELFVDEKIDVLAGLRPKLLEQQAKLAGSTILDESFMAVQQSIGCRPGRELAANYLQDFVGRAIRNGFVQSLIDKHAVAGKLSVAAEVAVVDHC